jgi:hypothetical protein
MFASNNKDVTGRAYEFGRDASGGVDAKGVWLTTGCSGTTPQSQLNVDIPLRALVPGMTVPASDFVNKNVIEKMWGNKANIYLWDAAVRVHPPTNPLANLYAALTPAGKADFEGLLYLINHWLLFAGNLKGSMTLQPRVSVKAVAQAFQAKGTFWTAGFNEELWKAAGKYLAKTAVKRYVEKSDNKGKILQIAKNGDNYPSSSGEYDCTKAEQALYIATWFGNRKDWKTLGLPREEKLNYKPGKFRYCQDNWGYGQYDVYDQGANFLEIALEIRGFDTTTFGKIYRDVPLHNEAWFRAYDQKVQNGASLDRAEQKISAGLAGITTQIEDIRNAWNN